PPPPPTTSLATPSLHDALPILAPAPPQASWNTGGFNTRGAPQPLSTQGLDGPVARIASNTPFPGAGGGAASLPTDPASMGGPAEDRKSTRLNSSHVKISYAVCC